MVDVVRQVVFTVHDVQQRIYRNILIVRTLITENVPDVALIRDD